jgi:integrase
MPVPAELFVNAEGHAMTRAGFEYVLTKHTRAAGEKCLTLKRRSVSLHQLRHSCAILMLQATRPRNPVRLIPRTLKGPRAIPTAVPIARTPTA